jgi:hypothetical protein
MSHFLRCGKIVAMYFRNGINRRWGDIAWLRNEGRFRATFEEVQAFLLKLTRQLRTLAPPAHVLVTLDQIEADVAERRAKAALV